MLTLNTQEIADLTGCTRKHITDRVVTRPDFPKPVIQKSRQTRLWSTAEIMEYLGRGVERKLRRTGPLMPMAWANVEAINAIYAKAKEISAQTGIPHHVDHILPINGELVSGLHVENNLQILTAAENIRKRNNFEIEG